MVLPQPLLGTVSRSMEKVEARRTIQVRERQTNATVTTPQPQYDIASTRSVTLQTTGRTRTTLLPADC
jgi:hypothetical protein